MRPTHLDIRRVQKIYSNDPEPSGWAELRARLTDYTSKISAQERIPQYERLVRALEETYTAGVNLQTPEALSTATGLLLQVETLLELRSIEVALGLPIRLSSATLGPLKCPTITCGWRLKEQARDGGTPGNGALAWGESVFGVLNPIPGCPRLVLPFLAANITSEPADGRTQKLLRESMCYGACMIANMLEVKNAVKINVPEMPDLVVDSGCIRALTLTITGRRIMLVAHWAVENGPAPPVYLSRIAKVWETNRVQGFPIWDALSSIHLAREWIMEVNTERYHKIIQKVYGFYETTCCICNHQLLSQGHCTACMHLNCLDCHMEWQEPNY